VAAGPAPSWLLPRGCHRFGAPQPASPTVVAMDSTRCLALALRVLLVALAVTLLVAVATALALLADNSAWAPPFS
jgi:hypothetical protein